MNKVRFKTKIFETLYFSIFGFFFSTIYFILILKDPVDSIGWFICMLILDFIILVLFLLLALLFCQYCEFIDGVFIFKCPLYVIKKVKIEDIILYDRLTIYEKNPRGVRAYPVIRIYLLKPIYEKKERYLCTKKSTYFHIYDTKDNYEKFIKIMNSK